MLLRIFYILQEHWSLKLIPWMVVIQEVIDSEVE